VEISLNSPRSPPPVCQHRVYSKKFHLCLTDRRNVLSQHFPSVSGQVSYLSCSCLTALCGSSLGFPRFRRKRVFLFIVRVANYVDPDAEGSKYPAMSEKQPTAIRCQDPIKRSTSKDQKPLKGRIHYNSPSPSQSIRPFTVLYACEIHT